MTPSQMIGYTLNQTSAITNIVSTRIYNGNRPDTTVFPSINYYEIPGGTKRNGFFKQFYSINCRAATAETALNLARLVDDLFNGTSGTGIYGSMNNFEITRGFTTQFQGLIPEPDDSVYNCPVDIQVFFPVSSIS